MMQPTIETGSDNSVRERTEGGRDAGRRYRYTRLALSTVLGDMYFGKHDPGPGDRVPAFDLLTVSGSRLRSVDLAELGPMLLVFGSATCPMTDSAAPGLNELHRRFGTRVRFVVVNVREAHPGQAFPQPATLEQKLAHARRLRDLHGFAFDVAVDDIDGTLHRALSPKPNSAYVLGTQGTVLFRAHWANEIDALESALAAVAAGALPKRSKSGGLVKPMLRMMRNLAPVLDRAGRGAWADMWRLVPPLAAIALVLKKVKRQPKRLISVEA